MASHLLINQGIFSKFIVACRERLRNISLLVTSDIRKLRLDIIRRLLHHVSTLRWQRGKVMICHSQSPINELKHLPMTDTSGNRPLQKEWIYASNIIKDINNISNLS